jgi:hypothetical protein
VVLVFFPVMVNRMVAPDWPSVGLTCSQLEALEGESVSFQGMLADTLKLSLLPIVLSINKDEVEMDRTGAAGVSWFL